MSDERAHVFELGRYQKYMWKVDQIDTSFPFGQHWNWHQGRANQLGLSVEVITDATSTGYLVVQGTPNAVAKFEIIVERASLGSTKTYTYYFHIVDIVVSVSEALPATLALGEPIKSLYLSGSGGSEPYKFGIGHLALPPGLQLTDDGKLSGTPKVSGVYDFWIGATDHDQMGGYAGSRSGWKQFLCTVVPKIVVNNYKLRREMVVNQSVERGTSFIASGGTSPYTFRIQNGKFPDGLVCSKDGVISNWPTKVGEYEFTVVATSSDASFLGHPWEGSGKYNISVLGRARHSISINTNSLPNAVVGHSYEARIYASGAIGKCVYASRTSGIDISSDGKVHWKKAEGTEQRFTVEVTDDASDSLDNPRSNSDDKEFKIIVEPEVIISPSSLPNGVVKKEYSPSVVHATGGGSYTYKVFGDCPPGLEIDPQSGLWHGQPQKAGVYTFSLGVAEMHGVLGSSVNGRREYKIEINDSLDFKFDYPSTSVYVGQEFSGKINAKGGMGGYIYSLDIKQNTGLSLVGNVISGTPKTIGPIPLTIRVTDSSGDFREHAFVINVSRDTSAADLALAGLRGTLYRNHIDIEGIVSGGGLSQSIHPDGRVVLKIQGPGETNFSAINASKLTWNKEWKADGWHFRVTNIPLSTGRALPIFKIHVAFGDHKSDAVTVPFPLAGYLPSAQFQEQGVRTDSFSVNEKTTFLPFYLTWTHPLDVLSARIELPDGVNAGALVPLPDPLEVFRHWDGRSHTPFFSIKAGKSLAISKDNAHVTLEIPVPVRVTKDFTSGSVKVTLQSDSPQVGPKDKEHAQIEVTLMLSKGA